MNKKLGIFLIIILIAIGAVMYFQKPPPKQTNNNMTAPVYNMNDMGGKIKTVEVKGFNTGFNPRDIKLKQGEMVSIQLISDDSPHTFTIDELGINEQFTYGKDASVSFAPDKKGVFQYYCAVPGHKEDGMVGTLTVE